MNSNSAVAVKSQAGAAKSAADEADNANRIAWWDGPMVIGGATLTALLAIWEYVSQSGAVTAYVLPAPSALVAALYEIFTQGFPEGITAPSHIWLTLQRILLGFILAGAFAIPLGIVIGSIPILEKLTGTVVTFGRSIAAISLLPLFIAWFGIGELSKVMLIALGAFWVIITNTITGVQMVDPVLIRAAQSMDTPRHQIFLFVTLPAALPRIFTGLRNGLAVAFMVIVAAEMIATVAGLGALIKEGRNAFRTDITMVGMFIIGLLGSVIVKLLAWAEARMAPWAVEGNAH